jgi:pseudoazurin
MRKAITLGIVAVLMSLAGAASAAEIEVKMLDKGADGVMVFEPAMVKIEPGDTVKFVATAKGHNAETIKGMLPADATPFVGKLNQDTSVTFDKPGVYGVKCLPHYGMGMVALVVVGTPVNKDEAMAVTHPGKAKQGRCSANCPRKPRRSDGAHGSDPPLEALRRPGAVLLRLPAVLSVRFPLRRARGACLAPGVHR